MSLEAATYIHELDASNPTGADGRAQGDDHIRMVKDTLQNTFPNVAGEVTPTHTELNYLDGATGVTGTGHTVRSAAPTLTGTVAAETINASGDIQIDGVSVLLMDQDDKAATYALVADDKGKVIDVTAAAVTIQLGALTAGFTAVIMATAASVTISATSGTLRFYKGDGNAAGTGNRTLARSGVCTVYKDASGDWRVFGTGLS